MTVIKFDTSIHVHVHVHLYIILYVVYINAVFFKGFRTKNRDLMRQDIIDVLRTSHMDLVRALIGLPPYAVHRWHMAYHKVVSTFAFKLVLICNVCSVVF